MPNQWENEQTTLLFKAILRLDTVSECERFFRDLLTMVEIQEISMRFKVAKLLYTTDKSYFEIAKEAKTTTSTVTRVAHWLKAGTGGYQLILDRIK